MLISIGNVEVLQAAVKAMHVMLEESKRAGAEEECRFCALEADVRDTLRAAQEHMQQCRNNVRQCTALLETAEQRRALAEARLAAAHAELSLLKYYA